LSAGVNKYFSAFSCGLRVRSSAFPLVNAMHPLNRLKTERLTGNARLHLHYNPRRLLALNEIR